jgi:hypothetical protein
MSPLRRALAAVTVLVGACVMPPTQSTLGAIATTSGVGARASVGAHSLALDDRAASVVDLGAGWVVEHTPGRGTVNGTYMALAHRVRGAFWLGARAELFWNVQPGQPRRDFLVRAALRRHLGGIRWASRGGGSGALGVLGAVATSLFIDIGARQLDGRPAELFATGGVALDLPAFAAASR